MALSNELKGRHWYSYRGVLVRIFLEFSCAPCQTVLMPKKQKQKQKPAKKRKPRPPNLDANQIAFRVLNEATQGKTGNIKRS